MQTFQQFKEKLLREDATDLEKEDALEAADSWLMSVIWKHRGVVRDLTDIQNEIVADNSYEEIVRAIDRKIASEMQESDPKDRNDLTIKALTELRNAVFNKSL